MSDAPDAAAIPVDPRQGWRSCLSAGALWLVVFVTLARLIYLAWFCPYNLIEDEAQYWVWSLRPDWSYYSKGPAIAWSIWASTHLFGVSEFGVRAFAPLYGAIAALCIGGLAADASRDRRAAFAGVAVFYLIPLFAPNATFVMTIDSPMVAFWALSCWAAFRAFYRESRSAWIVLGFAIAIGFLFKYTVALLVASLVLAAIIDRANLRLARPALRWVLLATVLALLGLLPIAIWNSQNGWPAIKHFLGHAKLPGGDQVSGSAPSYNPKWTAEFLAIQIGAVGPILLLMWWAARQLLAQGGAARSAAVFLLAAGLPTLIFYFFATFLTGVEGNWTMGAFISLASLAGIGVVAGMSDWRARMAKWRALPAAGRPKEGWLLRRPETLPQVAWHFAIFYGIAASLLMLRPDWLARVPLVGERIAIHRWVGVKNYADAIDRLWREQAPGSLLISYHYGVASQLTFYLPNHPMVFVAGSRLGFRRTQWDLWPDMSLSQESLRGKNAVLIGGQFDQWQRGFERVREIGHLPEDPRKDRWTRIGENFKGFDSEQAVKP